MTDRVMKFQVQEMSQLFLGQLTLDGLSENTIRAYSSDLKGPFLTLSSEMTRTEIETHLAKYLRDGLTQQGWAIRTHNRRLACYRSFGRYVGWQDFLATYKRPPNPAAVPHPLPEGVDGVVAMIEGVHREDYRALAVLTGLCGLRVSEARKVRPSHVQSVGGRILLTVLGKGNKTRTVPLSDKVIMWLIPRLAQCVKEDALLVPLSDRATRRAVTKMGRQYLERDTVASHDMRMTAGTAFFATTKNIRAVQDLLGHASSATTDGYTGVSMDAMSEAVEIV